MKKLVVLVLICLPFAARSIGLADLEKESLIQIIYILGILLCSMVGWKLFQYWQKHNRYFFTRLLNKVHLEVELEKDKLFRPRVLTLTIRNTGKNEVEFEAPVLEFRKIWSKRKFKLNGISGRQIYPLFLEPGDTHQLVIETSQLHQYDKSIKSFYWAQVHVSDLVGRKWKSKPLKLRKSLVT